MAGNASASRTIASRYADALFSLAKEQKKAAEIGAQLAALIAVIHKSKALNNAVYSPLTERNALGAAAGDIAEKAGADKLLVKAVRLMGASGRLPLIERVLAAYDAKLAEENDVVVATVITSADLKAPQKKKLEASLKESMGKEISLKLQVDEQMIGGMMIKVGSKLLDYSVRGRLAALQTQLHKTA